MWQDVLTLAFFLQSMAQEKMAWNDLARRKTFQDTERSSPQRKDTSTPNQNMTGKQLSCKLFSLEG